MLEIIALIFLTRRIGDLAEQKGESKGKWKAFTVLAWFGFEIVGIIIGMALMGEDLMIVAILMGLLCAFGGYLLVKYMLEQKPDVDNSMDDLIESIGVEEETEEES